MARRAPKPPDPRRVARNSLRRKIINVVLMVPDTDWARVLTGEKRMFRSYSRRPQPPAVLPTPVVAYRLGPGDRLETAKLLLEETWQEPLGVISAADLAAEGFSDLASFRRYFAERYPHGGYRPLAPVQVYRVRPLTDDDLRQYADRVLEYLGYV